MQALTIMARNGRQKYSELSFPTVIGKLFLGLLLSVCALYWLVISSVFVIFISLVSIVRSQTVTLMLIKSPNHMMQERVRLLYNRKEAEKHS